MYSICSKDTETIPKMADSAIVVLPGWSLILGELLPSKCIESELEIRFIMTNGHLEEKRNE